MEGCSPEGSTRSSGASPPPARGSSKSFAAGSRRREDNEMTHTQTIGWIGLGKMGLPIATRLAAAGYEAAGFDRDQQRIAEASAGGVAPAATLADAAGRDIVFTSLPDDKVLAAVALSGGLFDAM